MVHNYSGWFYQRKESRWISFELNLLTSVLCWCLDCNKFYVFQIVSIYVVVRGHRQYKWIEMSGVQILSYCLHMHIKRFLLNSKLTDPNINVSVKWIFTMNEVCNEFGILLNSHGRQRSGGVAGIYTGGCFTRLPTTKNILSKISLILRNQDVHNIFIFSSYH